MEEIGYFLLNFIGNLALLLLWVGCAYWVYKDAEKQGQPGCMVATFVLFLGPAGLLIWLFMRANPRYFWK
jgi:hypothetical protein